MQEASDQLYLTEEKQAGETGKQSTLCLKKQKLKKLIQNFTQNRKEQIQPLQSEKTQLCETMI